MFKKKSNIKWRYFRRETISLEKERVRAHSKGLIEFESERREIAEDPARTRGIARQDPSTSL